MCSFSLSLSNPTYLGPFVVMLGGIKYRPAAPTLTQWPPTMKTALPPPIVTPLRDDVGYRGCQVRLSCRPVRLQSQFLLRRLGTVLDLKRKLARTFLQELFGEALLSVSLSRLSWAWSSVDDQTSPVMKRAISMKSDHSIVHRCLGATRFSSNVPVCVSFSM